MEAFLAVNIKYSSAKSFKGRTFVCPPLHGKMDEIEGGPMGVCLIRQLHPATGIVYLPSDLLSECFTMIPNSI